MNIKASKTLRNLQNTPLEEAIKSTQLIMVYPFLEELIIQAPVPIHLLPPPPPGTPMDTEPTY